MKRKKLLFFGFAAILLFIIGYHIYAPYFANISHIGSFGAFKVGVTADRFNGLCFVEKIWKENTSPAQSLASVLVCEDNISEVTQNGDWLIIRTKCEREISKNLNTGEEIKNDAGSKCFGGGISFE